MEIEIRKEMSYGHEVYNLFRADSKRFIVDCNVEDNATLIKEILEADRRNERYGDK